ncbi:MAG: TetR/AcrR family transcriptional regulator [Kofleriaceae bacterium]|nr:TetR/AcrR family transcriptional regulator [Kofleriaceae bacterium]
MAKKRTAPRKQPSQARSQATVDAIVTAAERILEERGLDTLTTARVAEVAGVSVGTLYQYFPSKEAILAVLGERNQTETLQIVERVLAASRSAPLADAIRVVVRALVSYFRTDRGTLQNTLTAARPSAMDAGAFVRMHMQALASVLASHLQARKEELRVDDCETAAFLLISAADGVAQALAHTDVDEAKAERVIAEGSDVIVRYLLP